MFSIIIPTYNEGDQIAETIGKTNAATNSKHITEIIVVDGGSSDNTVEIARDCGATVITSERKGRAAQLNKGASIANYNLLYFLHADSIPPNNFTSQLLEAHKKGIHCGCFRLEFDHDHWFLKANAWFTRFNVNALRFGDQSLFVTKDVFEKAGGYREELLMMEDQEIIYRLKQYAKFKVLNDYATTSARKYLDNGIYRMQGIFFRIWSMYYLGCKQEQMLQLHRKLIRKNKL